MQAVLLAAGQSSRFYPLTDLGHKCFAKIAGKTLLEHTLSAMVSAGVTEAIVVVSNRDHAASIIGSDHGLSITFVEQPEPLGMGDALLRAREHIRGEFFLVHPHHVDFADFAAHMTARRKTGEDIVLLAREEISVEKYGVLRLDGDRVTEIVEKPKKGDEPSNLRVVGIYSLPKKFLDTLTLVPNEHYNIEHAISLYAKEQNVFFVKSDRPSITLKHPWDLLTISDYVLTRLKKNISSKAEIAKSAHIEGPVVIEENVKVLEHATIKGPAYIGKNTVIGTNAIVRNGVSVGAHAVIGANMEVRGSIIMDSTTTHSGFIGDSVIGRDCKIGAQFLTTNVRLDRSEIRVMTKQGEVASGRKNFGCVVGDSVKIGGKTTTMPGVLIGNRVVIGPSTTITHTIEEDVTYYTKFQEVVIKHKAD